jgi:hypothetical protein
LHIAKDAGALTEKEATIGDLQAVRIIMVLSDILSHLSARIQMADSAENVETSGLAQKIKNRAKISISPKSKQIYSFDIMKKGDLAVPL